MNINKILQIPSKSKVIVTLLFLCFGQGEKRLHSLLLELIPGNVQLPCANVSIKLMRAPKDVNTFVFTICSHFVSQRDRFEDIFLEMSAKKMMNNWIVIFCTILA